MNKGRYYKFLASFITGMMLFTQFISPALAAAPNHSANLVKSNRVLSNSPISLKGALPSNPEFTQQESMMAGDTIRIPDDSNRTLLNSGSYDALTSPQWYLVGFQGIGIFSIAFSPNYIVDRTILIGGIGGVYRSTDKGKNWTPINTGGILLGDFTFSPNYGNDQTVFSVSNIDGVYRSTDGGMTWSMIGLSGKKVQTLVISPDFVVDHELFAGVNANNNGYVFRSIDGGVNWTDTGLIVTNFDTHFLGISPDYANDHTIFLGTGRAWQWYGGGVYRSTDSGNNWEAINNGLTYQEIGALAISPNYRNDHTLFITAWAGGVFRSTDGGDSWVDVNNGQPNRRLSALGISPNYASDHTIFLGTWGEYADGGVYVSTNNGESWAVWNNGLSTRWIHRVAVSPNYTNDHLVFAGGEQSNGGGLWTFRTPWTIMVYLDGDNGGKNSLDNSYLNVFNQLEIATNNSNINIIAAWDRLGSDNSNYYQVQYNTDLNQIATYTEGVNRWSKGELNMGNPASLSDFIQWARTNYPAEHYALLISDHGTGLNGTALDSTNDGDWLTVNELGSALSIATSNGSNKLDIVFADSCLMGMIEDGYQIRNHANIYIASENLIWIPQSGSQPYSNYFAGITSSTTPQELATKIINDYASWLDNTYPGQYGYTLSAVDLTKIGPLVTAISDLSTTLQSQLSTFTNELRGARNAAQKFDSNASNAINASDEYVDLSDLASELKQRIVDANIQNASQGVIDAINAYVIGSTSKSGSDVFPTPSLDPNRVHGVSIFFPTGDLKRSFYNGINIDFASDAIWSLQQSHLDRSDGDTVGWGALLVDYVENITPSAPDDPNPPDLTSAPPVIPVVTSISLTDPNPTSATNVGFTVTFSEPVTNVDLADFTLTKTGTILGESLDNVSGGPTIYTVSVSTGTGSGDLHLNIISEPSIQDLSGNALIGPYTDGETYIVNKNLAPTDITLSNTSFFENQAIGTLVGNLTTTDPDASDTHAYSFACSTSGVDDTSFQVSGNNLQTNAVFDYETKNTYAICIRTDDGHGGTFDKNFTIIVTDANDPPTDIGSSNSSVDENQPVGTLVGSLTTTDPDTSDTHTYSFDCSTSGVDDTSFQVNGNNLQTNAVFDYETKNTYTICIRTEDGHGGTFDKNFTINVTDVIETLTSTFRSVGAYDGWILESTEISNKGGTLNKTATSFNLGDNPQDKQYRAILSFNTASLPDTAVITKVTLKIRKAGLRGTDPFTILGGLRVDTRKPFFGTSPGLVASDFQAPASREAVGTFGITQINNWYSAIIGSAAYSSVNLTGSTQFRLRFYKDDNNNMSADNMTFYSGNYAITIARPMLIIEFYVP